MTRLNDAPPETGAPAPAYTGQAAHKSGAALPVVAASIAATAALWVVIGTLRMVVICWNALPFGDQWGEIVTGRNVDWA